MSPPSCFVILYQRYVNPNPKMRCCESNISTRDAASHRVCRDVLRARTSNSRVCSSCFLSFHSTHGYSDSSFTVSSIPLWSSIQFSFWFILVSSGSIVSDYGLDDRAIGVRFPAGVKNFSSILCVQTGSEAHAASCTMGTGGPFPGGKSAAGAWRWPLTPT
jgi:hypothetical protein